jgi:hypothetical protein
MAGRVPAIFAPADEARMAGTRPAMTMKACRCYSGLAGTGPAMPMQACRRYSGVAGMGQ